MATEPEHRLGELLETSNPPFERVLSRVFEIEARETRTSLALVDRPGSAIEELEGPLDRDRSSINRAMTTLYK